MVGNNLKFKSLSRPLRQRAARQSLAALLFMIGGNADEQSQCGAGSSRPRGIIGSGRNCSA